MDYLDFELRIGEGNGGEYPVTVIHAAAGGDPSIMAHIPVNDESLRRQLDEFIVARSTHVAAHRSATPSQPRAALPAPFNETQVAREIGQRLFAALISGGVRDAYASSLVKARERAAGLRLRLRIEAPEVAVLPWEFLYDPQEGDHLSLLRETPLTRYTALPRERDLLSVKPPLRILGMVAAPSDLVPLDVTQEQKRIEQALEHPLERGDVELHWVRNGTWITLQQALDNGPWHVFHFIGHGAFDAGAGEGVLAFCNEQGTTHFMSATGLGRLFSGHAALRLAFLNACEGGRTSEAELFSSVGAVLTRRGVPLCPRTVTDLLDRFDELLAIDNATRGLDGLDAVPAAMLADLDANWEVLGEPIQSAMRALGAQGVPGMEEPYERLKELTRGRRIGQVELVEFVRGLGLPSEVEERLAAMTPATYVGLAPRLVDHLG